MRCLAHTSAQPLPQVMFCPVLPREEERGSCILALREGHGYPCPRGHVVINCGMPTQLFSMPQLPHLQVRVAAATPGCRAGPARTGHGMDTC